MRIGLFVPTPWRDYDRVQSAIWIRAFQLIEPLRAAGHDVSLNNPLRRYDVAIYHRGMLRRSVQFVRFLRLISRRVYWDTCVDYFDPHEAASAEHVACAREIAGLVDGVVCTVDGIAESARRFNANTFVMPDPVDLDHFAGRKGGIDWSRPTFVWSGVACKAGVLDPFAELLDGRCRIIAEQPPPLSFAFEFERWRHRTFPEALMRGDVGFLPRKLTSSYERNNSSFKALVFAVLGIPIIANRLPSYQELARHYDGIVFLEDFDGDVAAALRAVSEIDCNPERVRLAFDRFVWARKLSAWLAA